MVSYLVLLDSLASSSMATQTVRKASRSMDPLRFLAKGSDEVIIDRLGAQASAFSDSMRSRMNSFWMLPHHPMAPDMLIHHLPNPLLDGRTSEDLSAHLLFYFLREDKIPA